VSLGKQLQRAREVAGLSQQEVAERAGMSRVYVSILENDRQSPTVDKLTKLCVVLGVRLSVLIARTEKEMQEKNRGS